MWQIGHLPERPKHAMEECCRAEQSSCFDKLSMRDIVRSAELSLSLLILSLSKDEDSWDLPPIPQTPPLARGDAWPAR